MGNRQHVLTSAQTSAWTQKCKREEEEVENKVEEKMEMGEVRRLFILLQYNVPPC